MAPELTKEQIEAGWTVQKLGDLCRSVDYGFTASATEEETGCKFLRITDIKTGYCDDTSVPNVQVTESEKIKYLLKPGDIVVARTGATTGVSAWLKNPEGMVFASYLVRFSVLPGHNSRFIGYLLKTKIFKEYIHSVVSEKSAQPNASATTIALAELPIPPLDEQNRIAEILGSLDDKIEANNALVSTLSELAIAEITRIGLFSGESSGTLEDIISFSPRVSKPATDNYQFIDMAALPTDGPIASETMVKNQWTGSKFEEGDTLFSRITPCLENGKVAIAMGLGEEPAVGSTEFIVMRSKAKNRELLPYGIARHHVFRNIAMQKMTGTSGRQRVKWQDLATIPVNLDRIDEFALDTKDFELIRSIRDENIQLQETRDLLIRKLIK